MAVSSGEKPEGYYYARGVVRRIAEEECHQERRTNLREYWRKPSGEEVVQDMIERGWPEEEAREAVKALWSDMMWGDSE